MTTYHTALFIDPSIKALGWSLFKLGFEDPPDGQKASRITSAKFGSCGAILLGKSFEDTSDSDPRLYPVWMAKLDEMAGQIAWMASNNGVSLAGIEQPEIWGGTRSGRSEAAVNSGAILKLNAAAFSIRQALMGLSVSVTMIPVRRWKGNSPKLVTQRRIERAWGVSGVNHNAADAVGIGDWYIRKYFGFNVVRPSRM